MTRYARALAGTGVVLLVMASACVAPAPDPSAPARRDTARRSRPIGKAPAIRRPEMGARRTGARAAAAPSRATAPPEPPANVAPPPAPPATSPDATGPTPAASGDTTTPADAARADEPARPEPAPAPPAALPAPPPLDPEARAIVLDWVAPVDLDLYVTGPDARTVYFGNPTDRNGTLHGDAGCMSDAAARREHIELAPEAAGRYRIGVDASDVCGAPAGPITYRVVADVDGERSEATGTILADAFIPEALVLTVPASMEHAQ